MQVALRNRVEEVPGDIPYIWIILDDGTELILHEGESGKLSVRVTNREALVLEPGSETRIILSS